MQNLNYWEGYFISCWQPDKNEKSELPRRVLYLLLAIKKERRTHILPSTDVSFIACLICSRRGRNVFLIRVATLILFYVKK